MGSDSERKPVENVMECWWPLQTIKEGHLLTR